MARKPRLQVAITVDPSLMAALNADAEANFDSTPAIAATRLRQLYEKRAKLPPLPGVDMRQREQALKLAKLEREEAAAKKEIIGCETAFAVIRHEAHLVRTRLDQLPFSLYPNEPALREALVFELGKIFADLHGDPAEAVKQFG